ncbi:MAG: putative zinc-binding metallopeptidase [Myxococcota bacterium]|nr:putative zinc-binding metallopeptidase [Myxococcota bacterium]
MARRVARSPWWEDLSDEELLDLRFCDLGIRVAGSPVEVRLAKLHAELARAGFTRFRPHAWLSTSWFTPHGSSGFAVPFYLAHPRLVRVERWQIGDAEGSTREICMRLMRHEAAHALDNAYRLHRRAGWRAHFGTFSRPYRSTYVPRPASKAFVVNLDNWYAQSHPGEDWAETFAVWLRPGSRWRSRYQGWPALRKLEYVDALVDEIREQRPLVTTRDHVDSIATLRTTLRTHYARKRSRHHRVRTRPSPEYLR